MPKSGTWPGGVAMESLSNADSAGSSDSFVLGNSCSSADSMDHLSAEERACLMYLEETIEALEVQEDSESDSSLPTIETDDSDFKSNESIRNQKPFSQCAQPTPLILANGVSSLPPVDMGGASSTKVYEIAAEPKSGSFLFQPKAQHTNIIPAPGSPCNPDILEVSAILAHQSESEDTEPGSTPRTPPPSLPDLLSVPVSGEKVHTVPLSPEDSTSEIDVSLIPPPSDFMDEPTPNATPETETPHPNPESGTSNLGPEMETSNLTPAMESPHPNTETETPHPSPEMGTSNMTPETEDSNVTPETHSPHPKPEPETSNLTTKTPNVSQETEILDSTPEAAKDVPPPVDMSEPSVSDIEEQHKQNTVTTLPLLSTSSSEELCPEPPLSPVETPASIITPATSGTKVNPLPLSSEPRSPPAVAPKPKRLPANIILKSHKSAVTVTESHLGHPSLSPSDRLIMDPQKVRMEALRKLGLLKSEETEAGPALTPKLSPKSRRSWAFSASPISPVLSPPASAPPVGSPPPTFVPVPPLIPTSTPTVSRAAGQDLDALPAPPAAFCDPVKPSASNGEPTAAKDVSEVQGDVAPVIPPGSAKHLTPPKATSIKLAPQDLSGLDLRHASVELNPRLLRDTGSRPASIGSSHQFSFTHEEGSAMGNEDGKHPQGSSPSPEDAQMLPRSYGVSVLICPRAQNKEDRREALRKLGLLRD